MHPRRVVEVGLVHLDPLEELRGVSDPQVITFRPAPEQYAWTFGGAAPVARVRPPAVLEVFTEDCFAGRVRSERDLVSEVCEFPYLNPQTGPFYIEGAEPGDTLAVHFISIEPARDWGASTTVPLFGALSATHATALLHDPLPELVWLWQLDTGTGTCRFTARHGDFTADLPMEPMHGTVGVAPANLEVRSALVPDAFGGNMDTPEMRAGVTCYLGVNVEGALLSLGDGHARQGEGETCGVAVECAMNTVLAVDLIKGRPCAWPRLESDTHLMTAGSARPLEDAFRIAALRPGAVAGRRLRAATSWTPTSWSPRPSRRRWPTSATRTTPAWPRCPSSTCPPADPMGGAHPRLRALAAAYRG